VAAVTPPTYTSKGKERKANAGGADFSPDGATVYWSSGETGGIYYYDVKTRQKVAEVSLNTEVGGRKFEDSYAVDVKVSADGRIPVWRDEFSRRRHRCEPAEVVGTVPVGRYPYALAVVGDRVCVANIGLFEYSPIPAPADDRFDKRDSRFAVGYPSDEARDGVEVEGRKVPGWASPTCRNRFRSGSGRLESPSDGRAG
jgi:hypothetical protein